MPSKDPVQRFQDILENVSRIEVYTARMNAERFLEDLRTYDAVERCLERISEAAKKLGDEAEVLCLGQRGLGCERSGIFFVMSTTESKAKGFGSWLSGIYHC